MSGLWSGATVGGVIGAGSGYRYATKNGINPWTGKPNNSVTLGRDMTNRVNPAANDIGNETITNDWNNATNNNFNDDILAGKQFNKEWISIKIEEGYYFYDIGPGGVQGYSPNYNLELRTLYDYPRVYRAVYYKSIHIIIYY